MSTLLWLLAWFGGLGALAYHRIPKLPSLIAISGLLIATTFFSAIAWYSAILLWGLFIAVATFWLHPDLKKQYITKPIYDAMQTSLPVLSTTEKEALEAGTVGWDGQLFSGNPDWKKLFSVPAPNLSPEEQAFIDNEVKTLCEMTNDWEVTHKRLDLSESVWNFIRNNGFFGLVIPKEYGGKGFSELAHSEILTKLAGRSLTLSSTVSVPNSLGPAELILRYGTKEQKEYYLPKLAKGEAIPCFALTGPEAGSDAGAIPDTGVICKGKFDGETVTGIKLNWDKRYITLAPVATLLGLAFKLKDPDNILGKGEELGITCALIPTDLKGITIGRRHLPVIPFQNGPTQGKNVFIPLDYIIGGADMAGQGWRMLVECLSVGRAISLPSSSAGGAKVAAFTTGAYSYIRRQFRTPLCKFEGVQASLARIAGYTYLSEAIRYFTVSTIDTGEKPAVPTAIAKYHVTEFGRYIANDAFDVHAGKAIMMGPTNYLARGYQGVPVGITVEGANILTRSMIIFGQGAIRCHPYVLEEIKAVQDKNFKAFEYCLEQHMSFTISNAVRSLFHALTFARFAKKPTDHHCKRYYQQLARASSAFALSADVAMATIGGKLKFKEGLSGRLGDLLSYMYMMSATLKRFRDHGHPQQDYPLVKWCLDYSLARYWDTMDDILRNLPNKFVAIGLRALIMPFGHECRPPSDKLNKEVTELISTPCETRNRLLGNIFVSDDKQDGVAQVEAAFQATFANAGLLQKVYDATKNDIIASGSMEQNIKAALEANVITADEYSKLSDVETLCQAAIKVDDFDLKELFCMISPEDNHPEQHFGAVTLHPKQHPGSDSIM